MIDILYNILSFIFALGVIIFVHELGHLLVAKWFDVRCEAFSLGFGPRLWARTYGETEYRVSAIPLGGYVKLGGEQPDETEGDPREFLSKPRWQRILVYLAGPAMNVILAIGLMWPVLVIGTEMRDLPGMPPVIGGVLEDTSGAAAGIRAGDRVTAVDGKEVDEWPDVSFALMTSPQRQVELTLERDGQPFTARVTPGLIPKYEVGDLAGLYPESLPSVIEVFPDTPAAAAGLQAFDQLRTVNGRAVTGVLQFIELVQEAGGEEIVVGVLRDGERVDLTVAPKLTDGTWLIGIRPGFYQRYPPLQAIVQSVRYNIQTVEQTLIVLRKIFTGELKAKGALAGPIEIAAQTGAAAQRSFKDLIHLMAFISISIAFVNLLPIPILDGGQITILLVESTMRRDLSFRLKELFAQFGFVVIILLMLVVIYFDISKNWPPGFLSGG